MLILYFNRWKAWLMEEEKSFLLIGAGLLVNPRYLWFFCHKFCNLEMWAWGLLIRSLSH